MMVCIIVGGILFSDLASTLGSWKSAHYCLPNIYNELECLKQSPEFNHLSQSLIWVSYNVNQTVLMGMLYKPSPVRKKTKSFSIKHAGIKLAPA